MLKTFKYLSNFIFSILFCSSVYSQSQTECGFQGYTYKNLEKNKYWRNKALLKSHDDSLQNVWNQHLSKTTNGRVVSGLDELVYAAYRLPVKMWLFRNSNGTAGPNSNAMQIELDRINEYYRDNNANIQFYITGDSPTYVNNDNSFNVETNAEAGDLVDDFYAEDIINIHIVNNLNNAGIYFSDTPFFQEEGIVIGNSRQNATLSHEIGHHLGLNHTHENGDEPIDRNRREKILFWDGDRFCEFKGDGFCDTPADPNLDNRNSPSCTFTDINATDRYGDHYASPPSGSSRPDYTNILSYASPRSCRRSFSAEQMAWMRQEADGRDYAGFFNHREAFAFDRYEPDNQQEIARAIGLGDVQHHSFHWAAVDEDDKVYNDRDWVRFSLTYSTSIDIRTNPALHKNPDTEIKLYRQNANNTITQLAYDNNGNGNLYSRIVANNLAIGNYLIEIATLAGNDGTDVADYYLSVDECTPASGFITGTFDYIDMVRVAKTQVVSNLTLGNHTKLQVKAEQSISILSGSVLKGDFTAKIYPSLNCSDTREDIYIYNGGRVVFDSIKQSYQKPIKLPELHYPFKGQKVEADIYFQLYPNPTSGKTIAEFSLNAAGGTRLSIYNMSGQVMATPIDQFLEAGSNQLEFDTSSLPSGVYIVKFETNKISKTEKLVVIK